MTAPLVIMIPMDDVVTAVLQQPELRVLLARLCDEIVKLTQEFVPLLDEPKAVDE